MTPAERTVQRADALRSANTTRLACARFKRNMAQLAQDEAISIAIDLLSTEEEHTEHAMTVRHLLCAIPSVHEHKSAVLLRRAGIMSAQRRVRDLTGRQRLALASLLADRRWYG